MSSGRQSLAVDRLLRDEARELRLELLAGREGLLGRDIREVRVQKPGHALTGFVEQVKSGRVQVLGRSELSYLGTLEGPVLRELAEKIATLDIPCLVATHGLKVPDELREACESSRLPLLRSHYETSEFIDRVEQFLEDRLTGTTSLHGVLIDVFGVGVLILGRSGIGKSECALDLVMRGHRLVADDIVEVRRRGETLVGKSSDVIRYHMEVRGLGIINVKDLFGIAAVRDQKKIELVVELESWKDEREYERLGVDDQHCALLGMDVPQITLPVSAARNLTTLIEVAARNHLLKLQGHHSAIEFQKRLSEEIALSRDPKKFGGDVE